MKCHLCGGHMENLRTDLPFKLENHRIIVVKDIPVEQCSSCGQYVIHDPVMESLDYLFESMDKSAELEVRRFAA